MSATREKEVTSTSAANEDVYRVAGAVVVGVDGSESSLQALEWAAEYARLTSRRLVAVTTWEWPVNYGVASPGWPSDLNFEKDATSVLRDAVDKALGPDAARQVTQMVIHGHAAQVLTDASTSAAVVIVGTRGHGEFTGMLLGSVGEYLTTHGHCPVVVFRS
jgi:nucleotide-binding universal stress UspA family protein